MARPGLRGGRSGVRARAGAALVTVVLLSLALFALAHGMLTLALGELAASRAALRHLEAWAAAEGVVNETLAAPGEPWMDSVPVGDERLLGARYLGRAEGRARLRRLSAEAWWVEGVGAVGVAESRTARLAWALDPLQRVLSIQGVASTLPGAPFALAGTVDASSPTDDPSPATTTACDPWRARLDAHYVSDPLAVVSTWAVGDSLPRVGSLDFAALLASAPVVVTGSGAPAPLEVSGDCDVTDEWNWGDPDRPWRPCGSHFALRAATAGLVVMGGAGQGVLVVDGDVTLRGAARYYGLVIASGALRLEDSAALEGMALATGGLSVASGARVRGSACWAVRALASQRATLGRPRAVPGVGWLGPI